MLQPNALIVDTSKSIRNYVREVLRQELGFHVIHEAKDADSAFRALNAGRGIDWIFTSLEMPGLPPRDLLGTARNGPNGEHPRFVLMSSEDEIVTREIAIREGAADYLCKPFSPNQLACVVHRLTGLTEQRGAERFKVAQPCEINIGFDSFHQYGAQLAEISMTGCRLRISQVKPGSGYIDDYATVTLLPENGASFDAHAKIKRVEFSKSCADSLHNTEVTIEFIGVTPSRKAKLESLIESCKEKSAAQWQQ